MKKFIKKLFSKENSHIENQNIPDNSVIEEAVAVLLLRAANIDGKKDEKENQRKNHL